MSTSRPESTLSLSSVVFTRAAAFTAVVVGAAGLIGWGLNLTLLRSVYPKLIPTTANSSFALVLAGVALYALNASARYDGWISRRVFALACLSVMLGLAGNTVIETALNRDMGVDELIFRRPPDADYPVRMAPTSAVSLMLI